MANENKPRHLLTLLDFESAQVREILQLALHKKREYKAGVPSEQLRGKTGVMIFEKPSLRTRVTFEVGMVHLGGHMLELEPQNISLGQRESVQDAAGNLSRWVDIIVARTFKHSLVEELAHYSGVPVINALTDLFHPCQALALGLTLMEKRIELKGLHVVFVGDGNNVANSLAVLAAHTGMDFTLSCPQGYEMPQEVVGPIERLFAANGSRFAVEHDPKKAVGGADLVYTDVWVSMGQEHEAQQKKSHFQPYQVNTGLLAHAPEHCMVTHCLPAHRGEEITSDIMDSDRSICLDEAENRLHAQKAVLLALLKPDMLS